MNSIKKRNIYSRTDEDGTVYWYDGDMLHREVGPAIIEPNGNKTWWYEDQPHRIDGPASDYINGDYDYYVHGKLHRLDGPAFNIEGIVEWWVNGKQIPVSSQKEFEKMMKMKAFW